MTKAPSRQKKMALIVGRWSLQLYVASMQFHEAHVKAISWCLQQRYGSRSSPAVRPRGVGGFPVYDMALTPHERVKCLVRCGFMLQLVQRLMWWNGLPIPVLKCMKHQMRRVAAGVGAATPEGLFEEGLRLYAGGRYQAAVDKLKEAAALGHVAAHAELAWLLMNGREGVPADLNGAFKLAKEGAGLGCMHSLGVLAYCYLLGTGCRKNSTLSVKHASESNAAGSKYGQYVLGYIYLRQMGDTAQAHTFLQLAAAQGLDVAQTILGTMYLNGIGVAQDNSESLRFITLAAQQGYSHACFVLAGLY